MTPHWVVSVALVTVGRDGTDMISELRQGLSLDFSSCAQVTVDAPNRTAAKIDIKMKKCFCEDICRSQKDNRQKCAADELLGPVNILVFLQ
jgi:hypothetical protein